MNDVDDRLTDLLARSAAGIDVRPDVDAVLDGDHRGAPVVDLGRRPRDTRRLLALAAALLVVAGLAGLGLVASRGDDAQELAQAPAPVDPARFPVFGHLPADIEGEHVEANDGEGIWHTGLASTFRPEATVAHAAVGRVAADGRISDIIQLATADQGLDDDIGPPPGAEVEDVGDGYRLMTLGQEMWIYGPDRSLTAVGGPGTEEMVRALVDPLKAIPSPDAVLRTVQPPAGLALVAPPTLREPEQAEAIVPMGPPCSAPSRSMCEDLRPTVAAQTGVGPPEVAVVSAQGTVTPVDVGGGAGLMSSTTGLTRIAWTAPSGVTVSVTAEYGADETLAIARGIELVDEDTWRSTYPEWDEDDVDTGTSAPATTGAPAATTGPDATGPAGATTGPDTTGPAGATTEAAAGTHPLVGRPMTGLPVGEPIPDGRVMVLGFGPSTECAGCARLMGGLVDPDVTDWDPSPAYWSGEGAPDPGEIILAVDADDWLVTQDVDPELLATWSITELPTTVVVGPDGIVSAVFVGGTTVEGLEAAVPDAAG